MTTFLAADLPAPEIAVFLTELRRREASEHTIAAYCRDLVEFAGWFTEHLGLEFAVTAVTPTDMRDFRAYLRETKHQKPTTINRKLAALRSFFQWALTVDLRPDSPLATVKDLREEPRAPRWFPKREVDRLIRAIEASAKPQSRARDLVLVWKGLEEEVPLTRLAVLEAARLYSERQLSLM